MSEDEKGVWMRYCKDDTLGMVLVICAWLGALYFYLSPHSPGWAIGAFGFATFIAGYRPQASRVEKAGWLLALLLFMFLEFQAINRNDKDNQNARDGEKAQFQSIIAELQDQLATSKTQLTTSANQYTSTIQHVNEVLAQTQGLSHGQPAKRSTT